MTFDEWKQIKSSLWETAPISPTCEVMTGARTFCGKATDRAYPAMTRGWMALCGEHAKKHIGAFSITELIAKGERFE